MSRGMHNEEIKENINNGIQQLALFLSSYASIENEERLNDAHKSEIQKFIDKTAFHGTSEQNQEVYLLLFTTYIELEHLGLAALQPPITNLMRFFRIMSPEEARKAENFIVSESHTNNVPYSLSSPAA